MRSSSALVAIDPLVDAGHTSEDPVTHALAEFLGRLSANVTLDSNPENRSEEILVDTEVGGWRYLLMRMPRPNRNRIQLSPREQEIVRMVAKGHPNKVIADVLNISSWTVCTHLRRIFAKLGVGSRAAMVAQLLEQGLLPGEPRIPAAGR
jgi:DNA-binding CsgD family transcriptional regulator